MRECKIVFLCMYHVVGRRGQEKRKRKAAAKSFQSPDTWFSKVPRQEPLDAENDSAVCDDSPAETTTSDLSQLTTVLQRDIEGKSYLCSRCPPVLYHYYALRFSCYFSISNKLA